MKPDLRQLCLPVAVLTAVSLSACGSSSEDSAAAPQGTATSSTPSPTPTPSPTGLSKAEFVTKMEAVCVDTNTKVDALANPQSAEDYASLAAAAQGTLELFPQYLKQAEALVSQSGDEATLNAHWLTPEKADFAAAEPGLKKFIADVQAKDQAAVIADSKALDAMTDHSEAIAKFLTGYGLTSCAKLESD